MRALQTKKGIFQGCSFKIMCSFVGQLIQQKMECIKVKSFGPIEYVNVVFGDLTLLVGPQASGKSILCSA
jgi:hypothetical protein